MEGPIIMTLFEIKPHTYLNNIIYSAHLHDVWDRSRDVAYYVIVHVHEAHLSMGDIH